MLRSRPKKLNNRKMFRTIEGLPIGFNCTVGILASQNSYGFTAIYRYIVSGQENKISFLALVGSDKKFLQIG